MTQCGGDEALHWSAERGSICYESRRGANGAILHNNTLLCTFSTRLREHNIHRCWQLNNRCTQKKVIFLLNSIMLTQLWILNLQEMDYLGSMSWRDANKWHEDIHLAVRARVCEDCKIYSESCRGGLEGGYVRALIKNLVCKNKKAKACQQASWIWPNQTREDKCRAQRLLHVQINNGGPTAGMEETLRVTRHLYYEQTEHKHGLGFGQCMFKYEIYSVNPREKQQCQTAVVLSEPLAGLRRVPLQWDT